MIKEDKESDLYVPDDIGIAYEETKNKHISSKSSDKSVSGIWTIPTGRHNLQPKSLNDKFADLIEGIASFLKKSIDFCVIFIYNVYCNIKRHERTKNVKKSDNTKSKENSKTNTSKWYHFGGRKTLNGIIGIATLFVVVSIAHSAWVITQGTDDIVSLVMAVPMVVWAAVQLIKQFIKQGEK